LLSFAFKVLNRKKRQGLKKRLEYFFNPRMKLQMTLKISCCYYVPQRQKNRSDKLEWFQTALQLALKINNYRIKGAFASLSVNIAKWYDDLNDFENAKKNYELVNLFIGKPSTAVLFIPELNTIV
jgi:hypothetical protein